MTLVNCRWTPLILLTRYSTVGSQTLEPYSNQGLMYVVEVLQKMYVRLEKKRQKIDTNSLNTFSFKTKVACTLWKMSRSLNISISNFELSLKRNLKVASVTKLLDTSWQLHLELNTTTLKFQEQQWQTEIKWESSHVSSLKPHPIVTFLTVNAVMTIHFIFI